MFKYSYFYIKKNLFITILIIIQLIFLIINLYTSFDLFSKLNYEKKQISKIFSDDIIYGIEFRSSINSINSDNAFTQAEKLIDDYVNNQKDRNFLLTLNSVEPIVLDKFNNYENFKIPNSPEIPDKFYANSLHINSDTLKRFPFNISHGRSFNDEELSLDYTSKDFIPLVLGNKFTGIYDVGDSITLDETYTGIVIGILDDNQLNPGNITSDKRLINLDNYIIFPNKYIDNGSYITGGALIHFEKSASKEYINSVCSDIRKIFDDIGVAVDSRDFSEILYANINSYLSSIKNKLMISVIITIFIFVSITLTLLNNILLYKKDFAIHHLAGANTLNIISIIANQLTIISLIATILSIPFFAIKTITDGLNIPPLFLSIIFIVFLNIIVLIIPIISIKNLNLTQLIKGEE